MSIKSNRDCKSDPYTFHGTESYSPAAEHEAFSDTSGGGICLYRGEETLLNM